MLDFKKELEKLFEGESGTAETDEFGMLADEGTRLLTAIDRRQADISLQIEEIYDITQKIGTYQDSQQFERSRATGLLHAVVGLSDIIEDFVRFASGSSDTELKRQSLMMWNNAGNLLDKCSVTRFGGEGQPLDPELHSVNAAETSVFPHEHIISVLQSGYVYMGAVIRKASVVVSAGGGDETAKEGEISTDE